MDGATWWIVRRAWRMDGADDDDVAAGQVLSVEEEEKREEFKATNSTLSESE
jgi:hypothetical protein